jgi:ABC-2 type transport system ATP-binding protein
MIKIESATKIYTRKSPPAVDSLDLEIMDGQILGLVGLNGAGKTTSIRMASGIILPSSGHVMVDGHDIVSDKVKAASQIGWIPELPNFEPNAKPVELMRYFAGFYGIPAEEANKRIKALLAKVGLSNDLDKKLRNYSQGMKKRFAIAESIVGDPKNVLFDETLNGLDPEGVVFVRNLMFEMKREGKAILLSSHILSEVEDVADRVAIINHGKLIKLLSRNELRTLGKTIVKISVDNFDDSCLKMLKEFGEPRFDGHDVVLSDLTIADDQLARIPESMIKAGYKIRQFTPMGETLEEYFFSLIGEKQ